jgi:DNA-binding FrmR family transcriptional regulator
MKKEMCCGLPQGKAKALKCSRQAQGTILKVIEMIDKDNYCPEVIQQVDSVIGLLRSAKKELLSGHLDTCVAREINANKEKAIKELLKIYNLSN